MSRPAVGLTMLLLAVLPTLPACKRADLFRRSETLSARHAGPRGGSPVPEIAGDDFDGKPMKLSDHRGKVIVLVFWFSDCMPCRAMIPHERELALRYSDKPFVMVGVNSDENVAKARKIIVAEKMNWRIWNTGALAPGVTEQFGVKSYPSIFVIDPAGNLRYRDVRGPQLDAAVATLLAEIK